MFRSICMAVLLTTTCFKATPAQTSSTKVEFDVASVRLHKDAETALLQATPGRFSATGIPLRRLLILAYGVQDFQVVGEPAWTASDKYDVIAKAAESTTVQQMEGPMLQALLEERFKMKVHRETRLLPVYELTVAKSGPKLHPSDKSSCTPYVKEAQPVAAASLEGLPLLFCGFKRRANGASLTLDGKGVSLADLAGNLSHSYNTSLGRNIVDKSGISGNFNIHLQWTNDPDSPSQPPETAYPGAVETSIFTALEEQLGLKLQQAKGAVEVLVIDHIERPSSN